MRIFYNFFFLSIFFHLFKHLMFNKSHKKSHKLTRAKKIVSLNSVKVSLNSHMNLFCIGHKQILYNFFPFFSPVFKQLMCHKNFTNLHGPRQKETDRYMHRIRKLKVDIYIYIYIKL